MSWHNKESEKVKLQSRTEELNESENVRIYHHELHRKHIKRSQILKLETESQTFLGLEECAEYLENSASPAELNNDAQHELLAEVEKVFTPEDNKLLTKVPDKDEVKESVWSANLHAAPGMDGLTTFL